MSVGAYALPRYDRHPRTHLTFSIADAELIAGLQQGSEAAFRTLVECYQGRVYRTVLAGLPDG